jgi:hypothetical protein
MHSQSLILLLAIAVVTALQDAGLQDGRMQDVYSQDISSDEIYSPVDRDGLVTPSSSRTTE